LARRRRQAGSSFQPPAVQREALSGCQASRNRSLAFLLSALIVLLFDEPLDRNTGSLRQSKGVSEESHTPRPYPTMDGRIRDPAKRGSFRRAAHLRNRARDRVLFCLPFPPLHGTTLALLLRACWKNEPSRYASRCSKPRYFSGIAQILSVLCNKRLTHKCDISMILSAVVAKDLNAAIDPKFLGWWGSLRSGG